MGFEDNDYLAWYVPRVHAPLEIDLSSSGVTALALGEVEVPEVDPWQAAHAFESALAEWLSVPASEVLFTPGATGGTLLALLTLAPAGSEILVEAPIYEPMLRQAQRLATSVARFHRRAADGWRIDLDEVASAITPRTRVVMITEPSNPSGTFLPRAELLALAETAADHGAWLLVNEVYRGFCHAPSCHGAAANIVVLSSLSKLLGAYWARLGWLSAQPETIERLRRAHLNLGMQASPNAAFGLGLMKTARARREEAQQTAGRGRRVVADWVEATSGISWTPPQGPGFGCLQLPRSVEDDVRFAEALHRDRGVLAVPGTHFELPGTLRLSWLQAGERLQEGLAIIAELL